MEACARSLSAASSPAAGAAGYRFPPFTPDICLANFYERSGRLGMHQVGCVSVVQGEGLGTNRRYLSLKHPNRVEFYLLAAK